jgi:NAD(P)H-flavin reductase
MLRCEVTLVEVRLEKGGTGGRMECPPGLRPAPGQYLLAHAVGHDEALPATLFAARTASLSLSGDVAAGALELAPPLPPGWTAGTRLSVRGPLGRGFSLPVSARQVALVGLDVPPYRLLPLADLALAQGAAVALYTQSVRSVPDGLPPEVEVLPLEALHDVVGWADYVAFDLAPGAISGIKQRFGLMPHTPLPMAAQVLVRVPMPCGGIAECGLCAVQTNARSGTRRGWKLACKEGPVFDLNDLEEG